MNTKMVEPFESVVEANVRKLFNWREIWQYRELFYFFTWRDIKIKYKQTALGLLWAVLQPLVMMLVFTFFFGQALSIPSQNIPYPIFAFSGLLLWNTFSVGLTNSSNSMVSNAQIIKKIYFPRLIVPASSILVAMFDFIIAFIFFLILLLWYRQPVSSNAIWCWPLGLAISLLATLGPGCLLAALNVKYRDFRYVIPFLVQILFFLTPVIYPVSLVKYPLLQYVMVLSPMYSAVEIFRYPITGVIPHMEYFLVSLASLLFFLVAGIVYFKRTEDFFADFA
jgi:lipopolysaccharide transport system permease protein